MAILAAGITQSHKPTGIKGQPQEARDVSSGGLKIATTVTEVSTLELWKLIKGNLIRRELGGSAKEALTPSHLSIADPKERDRHYWWLYHHYYPNMWKERCSPPPAIVQPVKDSKNWANEKPLSFQLPVSSKGVAVYTYFTDYWVQQLTTQDAKGWGILRLSHPVAKHRRKNNKKIPTIVYNTEQNFLKSWESY